MSSSLRKIAKNDPRLLKPLKRFAKGKVNCMQAVLTPFVESDPPEVRSAIMSMTRPLGGGVAGMGYVCGALLGGMMALSRELDQKGLSMEESERILRKFSRKFGKPYGTLFCSGIKAQAGEEKQYTACQALVARTIEAVDEELEKRT